MRASSVGWSPSWQGALQEALRLNQVARDKFPDTPADAFRYRVRKRRGIGGRGHLTWKIYTPTGDIPRV